MVKRNTSTGGALSVLALGTVVCFVILVILDYFYANTLVSSTLLPVDLRTLEHFARTDAAAVKSSSSTISSIFPPIESVLQIQLTTVQGPGCRSPTVMSSGLLAGNISVLSATQTRLTFTCFDCVLGPFSALTLAFPPTCQSFHVTAVCVGATRSIFLASLTVPSGTNARNSNVMVLSSASIAFRPHLEIFNDTTSGTVTHGYSFSEPSLSEELAVAPVSVKLVLDLSVDSTYSLTTRTNLRTWTQLIASLCSLGGLWGIFNFVFRGSSFVQRIQRRRSSLLSASGRSTSAGGRGSRWGWGGARSCHFPARAFIVSQVMHHRPRHSLTRAQLPVRCHLSSRHNCRRCEFERARASATRDPVGRPRPDVPRLRAPCPPLRRPRIYPRICPGI